MKPPNQGNCDKCYMLFPSALPQAFYNQPLGSEAAATNAEKIFRLFSSVWKENSGCHCTAHTKVLSGRYTASTSLSSLRAISARPGVRTLIAWWW